MRRFLCVPLILLLGTQPVFAAATHDVTGLEWLQMSLGDRLDAVLLSMYVLSQQGVELAKSPNDYCNTVEEKLRLNPGLYTTSVTDILSSLVYENEPAGREALDKIRKHPQIQKIEMH